MRRSRTLGRLSILCAAFSFLLAWVDGFAVHAEEKPTPTAGPAVRDILDIHKALGGKLLKGTRFATKSKEGAKDESTDDDRVIAETIQKLETRAKDSPLIVRPSVLPQQPSASTFIPAATPSGQLRVAARRLDDLAADFEEQSLYAEADRLRGMARTLRLRARAESSDLVAPIEPRGLDGFQGDIDSPPVR